MAQTTQNQRTPQEIMRRIQACESILSNPLTILRGQNPYSDPYSELQERVNNLRSAIRDRERIFGILSALRWVLGADEETAQAYAQKHYEPEETK